MKKDASLYVKLLVRGQDRDYDSRCLKVVPGWKYATSERLKCGTQQVIHDSTQRSGRERSERYHRDAERYVCLRSGGQRERVLKLRFMFEVIKIYTYQYFRVAKWAVPQYLTGP